MATVEVGGSPINLPRKAELQMEIWTKHEDYAFGPHFGLQHGTDMLYISPTHDEIIALQEFCAQYLKVTS